MSTTFSKNIDGWDSVQDALDQLRVGREEAGKFFADLFEQFDQLSNKLADRHIQANTTVQQASESLQGRAEELDRKQAEIETLQRETEQVARANQERAAMLACDNESQVQGFVDIVQQQREELQSMRESGHAQSEQLSSIAAELAETRKAIAENASGDETARIEHIQRIIDETQQQREELQSMRESGHAQSEQLSSIAAELAETQKAIHDHTERVEALQPQPTGTAEDTEALHEQIRQLEQQHSVLAQERSLLESELESLRYRAAEMTESLAEQKRQAAEQQTALSDELKQMRTLLETLSKQIEGAEARAPAATPVPPAATSPRDGKSTDEASDPVLDSVMEQFEMLQKDLARRRAAQA